MIRPMAKRKRSEHYVNNKEFLAALLNTEVMLRTPSLRSMEENQ